MNVWKYVKWKLFKLNVMLLIKLKILRKKIKKEIEKFSD